MFGVFASSAVLQHLTTLYKAPFGRGCICLRPLCHKKPLIVGVYFSALPIPNASEKIYTHLFQRAAGRVGCMNLFSALPLRSSWFFRYAVPVLQYIPAPNAPHIMHYTTPPLRTLFGTRHKSKGSFPIEEKKKPKKIWQYDKVSYLRMTKCHTPWKNKFLN